MIFEQPGMVQSFPDEPIHMENALQEPLITPDNADEAKDYSVELEKFYNATGESAVRIDRDLFKRTSAEFSQCGMNYYIRTLYAFLFLLSKQKILVSYINY